MKITVGGKAAEKSKYPYVARHKDYPNIFVLIGMYNIVVLNHVPGHWSAGDNWDNQLGRCEYMFEPLKPGEIITLENE